MTLEKKGKKLDTNKDSQKTERCNSFLFIFFFNLHLVKKFLVMFSGMRGEVFLNLAQMHKYACLLLFLYYLCSRL